MESLPQMDADMLHCAWLRHKVCASEVYAQHLYAAMCNQDWQHQDVWTVLTDEIWHVSWRGAGRVVAELRGQGDYLDWYCSGMMRSHPDDDLVHNGTQEQHVPEGSITDEIREDLAQIGWHPVQST
jgi:hypothetical protein